MNIISQSKYEDNEEAANSIVYLEKTDNKQLFAVAMETINQVVNEAQIIVNNAMDSGDSQFYLSLNSFQIMRIDIGKSSIKNNKEQVKNKDSCMKNIATSTPQKLSNVSHFKGQSELIGQGDSTNVELFKDDDTSFPSMFITIDNLIDISEDCNNHTKDSKLNFEELQTENENENIPSMLVTIDNLSYSSENCDNCTEKSKGNEKTQLKDDNSNFSSTFVTIDNLIDSSEDSIISHNEEMNKIIPNIMDLPVEEVLNIAFKDNLQINIAFKDNLQISGIHPLIENASHTTYTIATDILLNAVDDETTTNDQQKKQEHVEVKEIKNKYPHSDYFENPFLTFNREEDQCSEKTDIQTPSQESVRSFHEVQLFSSKENLNNNIVSKEKIKVKKLSSIRSCRSALAHRCRQRYVRILACVRRWWTRGTPNKQQMSPESVFSSSFPLSPNAKVRANSLNHRSRTPKHCKKYFGRKFNSLNNVFLNSNRFKEYSIDHNNDMVRL